MILSVICFRLSPRVSVEFSLAPTTQTGIAGEYSPKHGKCCGGNKITGTPVWIASDRDRGRTSPWKHRTKERMLSAWKPSPGTAGTGQPATREDLQKIPAGWSGRECRAASQLRTSISAQSEELIAGNWAVGLPVLVADHHRSATGNNPTVGRHLVG